MKILLVDDEPKVLRGLEMVINRAGEDWQIVGQCKNGADALRLIRRDPPDVVVTDIKMPEMDGLELVKQSKLEAPEIQFVILSGYPDFQYAQQALKLGTVDYILKPPDYKDLLASLKRLETRKRAGEARQREDAELRVLAWREQVSQYLDALHLGDGEQAAALLAEIISQMTAIAGPDFQRFQDLLQEFTAALTKKLLAADAASLVGEPDGFIISAVSPEAIALLKNQLSNYTRTITAYFETVNNPGRRKVINHIMVFIQNNYFKDISLRQIAAEVYMNESYLSDLFKRETGVSFMTYLTRFRMEQAKELLKQLDLKTYEVAEMVGYQNSKYFNKVFKKQTGMTPFEYREKMG